MLAADLLEGLDIRYCIIARALLQATEIYGRLPEVVCVLFSALRIINSSVLDREFYAIHQNRRVSTTSTFNVHPELLRVNAALGRL